MCRLPACRMMGIHPSSYYRWRRQVLSFGLEILRPREQRPAADAERDAGVCRAASPCVRARPCGVRTERIAAEFARPKWGGIRFSPNGVWRVLRRHGLNTRARRLGLVVGYAAYRGARGAA
jgi:hypothetical protein